MVVFSNRYTGAETIFARLHVFPFVVGAVAVVGAVGELDVVHGAVLVVVVVLVVLVVVVADSLVAVVMTKFSVLSGVVDGLLFFFVPLCL